MKKINFDKYLMAALILVFVFSMGISLDSFAKENSIIVTEDPGMLSVNMNGAEPLHTEQIVIDTESGIVTSETGQDASLQDIFDISDKEQETLLSGDGNENKEQLMHFLEEDDLYCISDSGEHELSVSFPFAYKRILLFLENEFPENTYGADSVVYYSTADEYILDYSTEEAARDACFRLIERYGKNCVMPDLPVHMQGSVFSETESISNSWGIDMMQLDLVRDLANNNQQLSEHVTVAVLDSGIYPGHELFQGRLADDFASFVSGSPCTEDGSGHGTHVAGIIADGTSNQVNILPVKVLGEDGRGGFGELLNGIYHAVGQNADVINMSLAINLSEYGMYWSDVSYLQLEKVLQNAEKDGCLCVAAAGNDSANMDTLAVYPAISESTITVSSIDQYKKRASSSNYGESVDFAAPGDAIYSAAATGAANYRQMSGTSMAAPHVSAACAMLSLYNKNLSNEDMKSLLKSLAVDLGSNGKDKFFGDGLIVFPDGIVPQKSADNLQEDPNNNDPLSSDDKSGGKPSQNHSKSESYSSDSGKTDPTVADSQSTKESTSNSQKMEVSPGAAINISKAACHLSSKKYIFNGKEKKPTVTISVNGIELKTGRDYAVSFKSNKKVGTAFVIVTGKGKYYGTIKKTFSIIPKGISIIKLKKGKKQISVVWKKQTVQTKGYQIQYSVNKKFKNNVKTLTIRKTKVIRRSIKMSKSKKRYYVRIRTYQKVDGKNYYSPWSKVKSVVTQ